MIQPLSLIETQKCDGFQLDSGPYKGTQVVKLSNDYDDKGFTVYLVTNMNGSEAFSSKSFAAVLHWAMAIAYQHVATQVRFEKEGI